MYLRRWCAIQCRAGAQCGPSFYGASYSTCTSWFTLRSECHKDSMVVQVQHVQGESFYSSGFIVCYKAWKPLIGLLRNLNHWYFVASYHVSNITRSWSRHIGHVSALLLHVHVAMIIIKLIHVHAASFSVIDLLKGVSQLFSWLVLPVGCTCKVSFSRLSLNCR